MGLLFFYFLCHNSCLLGLGMGGGVNQSVLIFTAGAAAEALCCSFTLGIKKKGSGCSVVLEWFTDCCKSQHFHASVSDSIFKRAFVLKSSVNSFPSPLSFLSLTLGI